MKKLIVGTFAVIGALAVGGLIHDRYVANPKP